MQSQTISLASLARRLAMGLSLEPSMVKALVELLVALTGVE